jgi:hypothetical protein
MWIAFLLSISSVFEPEPKNAGSPGVIAISKTYPKLGISRRKTATLVADSIVGT